MNSPVHSVPNPPQPPQFERRIRLYPYQWIGFFFLFLIPILALFGVFGETTAIAQNAEDGIALQVTYVNRIHYQSRNGTQIAVTNTTGEGMPTLNILFERTFLDNYADLSSIPNISEINEGAYIVTLSDIQPDETQIIALESRAEFVGFHQGTITASTGDQEVSVTLEVFIFP